MRGVSTAAAYPAEGFYLRNVARKDRRLLALVMTVELGDIIHLDIIPDAISEAISTGISSLEARLCNRSLLFSHAMPCWSVPVVLAAHQIVRVMIL